MKTLISKAESAKVKGKKPEIKWLCDQIGRANLDPRRCHLNKTKKYAMKNHHYLMIPILELRQHIHKKGQIQWDLIIFVHLHCIEMLEHLGRNNYHMIIWNMDCSKGIPFHWTDKLYFSSIKNWHHFLKYDLKSSIFS